MATTKRKRVSKKNKKSWRKNVNINDVEDFLDEKRLEERTGFKVSELPNEELFQIYTTADNEDTEPLIDTKDDTSEKEDSKPMRLRESKTPKGFSILEKRSAVKDPVIKRNRVKIKEKVHPAVKKILQERLGKGILSAKQQTSVRDKKSKSKVPEFKYELWSKESKTNLENYSDWLNNDTVRHTLTNTGQKRVKPPKSITTKSSLLPAVEVPHPGSSYNPSLKDHREMLQVVAETEKEMVKEEKHVNRVTTKMFSKVKRSEAEKEWMTEMSAGLADTIDTDEEVTGDYTTVNPPVKNKKKTLQKRRKLREEAKLQAKLRLRKIEKRKISDIYKLRKFNAAIKKQEFAFKKLKEKREKLKALKPYETKQLSHTKYEEPLLDFSMIDELTGNLRGVKQKTNLLKDRYKSLQKRNILEPTVKHFAKKAKVKRYERESTKMGWEPKGY